MAEFSNSLQLSRTNTKRGAHNTTFLLPYDSDSVCPTPLSLVLLAESLLIYFPRLTKIFQFSRSSLLTKQFGNPWFKGRLRLPTAFRSLPRPSSILKPSHPLNDCSKCYSYFLYVNKPLMLCSFFAYASLKPTPCNKCMIIFQADDLTEPRRRLFRKPFSKQLSKELKGM